MFCRTVFYSLQNTLNFCRMISAKFDFDSSENRNTDIIDSSENRNTNIFNYIYISGDDCVGRERDSTGNLLIISFKAIFVN